jgi:hypothetical protein
MKSLYRRLLEAGCEIDNHESDLYVRDTPEARAIIAQYKLDDGIPGYQLPRQQTGKAEQDQDKDSVKLKIR